MLEARLQQVLSLLDEHSCIALRIRARLAAEADYRRGENARILAVLDEARAARDSVPLAEALSLAHHCLLGPDYVTLRRELAVELIKVSFRTERRSDRLMGLMWQTVDSYSQGDPHAGRFLGELRDHLDQHDHPAVGFVVSAIDVMLAIRAGDLDEAESLASICAKNGATAGDIDSRMVARRSAGDDPLVPGPPGGAAADADRAGPLPGAQRRGQLGGRRASRRRGPGW